MNRLLPFLILALIFSCKKADSPFNYVDPFIGTGGHGHTFPGATVPFGMVQLSPDTRLTGWDGCSGYHYSDSVVYGFSHTHLSGTGVSDYGDVLLMPFIGEINFNNGSDGQNGYRSSFSKESEIAQPGYYEMRLQEDDILVKLTASARVGFHQYEFPEGSQARVLIDLEHRDDLIDFKLEQIDDYTLSGFRHSNAWAEKQYLFFRIVFDQAIESFDLSKDNDGKKAALSFLGTRILNVKVAISAVDEEGAKNNLNEIPHWDFNRVSMEAKEAWNKQLSKIEVKGGSEEKKRIFYSALYHSMIAPNLYHDIDGRYRGTDLEIHHDTSFTNYTVFSLWDTYRSTHPLYTIIERKRTVDFIQTFLKQYEYGGRLPMWELSANYTGCMIGYHAVPVISDAFVKGIKGYDSTLALESMIHSSMQNRLGIDHFRNSGFISSDEEAESVSKSLEYAYDDWCIAVMADKMGKDSIANTYYSKARHYKNVLDPETGFMRARNNNRWFYPFDPSEVNFNYTEANSWQYSYYVPQDVEHWIELQGGNEAAEKKLDDIFSASSETSGRDQADITGLIGQYAHGNEPSHHIPYLYNFVGRADKTQAMVRRIMNDLYSDQPDGLSGNEDCGQMSSWLVMSAMGFYPVTPGTEDYILGSPWFDEVLINLENGKSFLIEARNNSEENIYIKSATLNGEFYNMSFLRHSDIMKGGKLIFEMSNETGDFGNAIESRPKSRIKNKLLAIPSLSTGDHAFFDSTIITISTIDQDVNILYAFDSTDFEGQLYERPFSVSQSTELFVWAEMGNQKSKKAKSSFYRIPSRREVSLETEYANHYNAGGDYALIDFIRGGEDFRTGAWQGYHGVDLMATVDLGKREAFQSISIGFLQDENSWIFMPEKVSFFVSENGEDFKLVGELINDISYKQKGSISKDFGIKKSMSARYVKIIAHNRGNCPPDHKGAGNPAWIFADEIVIR